MSNFEGSNNWPIRLFDAKNECHNDQNTYTKFLKISELQGVPVKSVKSLMLA